MPLQQVTYNDISQPLAIAPGAVETYMSNQGSSFGFRNRIINGAMVIDQRNSGASITPSLASGDVFSVDRWSAQGSQNSKLSFQQVSDAPTGFSNSLKVTTSTSYSVGSGDYFDIYQYIEGYNTADFAFGTANAKSITLSFWVKSSLTGTFGGIISNNNYSRCYGYSYTINASNTWQYVSVTIPGDTGGTWLIGNARGMQVSFSLACGSTYGTAPGSWSSTQYLGISGQTSLVGTQGATFQVTGVQLERGSTASAFEYRDYGREFQMCQRYFEITGRNTANYLFETNAYTGGLEFDFMVPYVVTKRVPPTVVIVGSWGQSNLNSFSTNGSDYNSFWVYIVNTSSGRCYAYNSSSGNYITSSAEL